MIVILIGLMIMWITMNIIYPSMVADTQGDEWEKVFKAIVHMRINDTDVVEMNNSPIQFLEKEEGMLKLYLQEQGNIVEYFGEFMHCEYINEEGNKIELEGRKCTRNYTIWDQINNE